MLIVLPWANVHFSDTFQPQACIALYVTKGVEGVQLFYKYFIYIIL